MSSWRIREIESEIRDLQKELENCHESERYDITRKIDDLRDELRLLKRREDEEADEEEQRHHSSMFSMGSFGIGSGGDFGGFGGFGGGRFGGGGSGENF